MESSSSLDLKNLGLCINPDGFGPLSSQQPWADEFDGKLFQPYNKKEKIGKVCDFVSATFHNTSFKPTVSVAQQQQKSSPAAAQELLDEEEKGFEVIEESANIKKKLMGKAYAGAVGGGY
jgi:hypothetical protein